MLASYRFLGQWTLIAALAGLVGASTLELFRWLVTVTETFLVSTRVPIPISAAVAGLVVGAGVYRFAPDAAGEGIPSYLHALHHQRAHFPLRVTLMKFPAGILSLAAFGSGGVVGPVGRVVAGLLSAIMPSRGGSEIRDERARTAAICGLAAIVAALFHAPVGGGIFAVEIIQRANMRYRDLFPSILAGTVSVWFSRFAGWSPLITVVHRTSSVELGVLPWVAVFAVLVGLLGGGFVQGYGLAVRVFRRNHGRAVGKVVFGMAAAALLVSSVNPAFLGTASRVTNALANGEFDLLRGAMGSGVSIAVAALIMLLVRAAGTYLTTGSGMSAGLTAPAIQVGMLAAVLVSRVAGPLADPLLLSGLLVVGFSGMLAGAMNVPIAAAVLGMEVFGAGLGMPAAIASIVAFQMNRHATIYDFALAGSGHLDEA